MFYLHTAVLTFIAKRLRLRRCVSEHLSSLALWPLFCPRPSSGRGIMCTQTSRKSSTTRWRRSVTAWTERLEATRGACWRPAPQQQLGLQWGVRGTAEPGGLPGRPLHMLSLEAARTLRQLVPPTRMPFLSPAQGQIRQSLRVSWL